MNRISLALDGAWQFWADPDRSFAPENLPGHPLTVSVPAPWQSQDESLRNYTGVGWYRRSFSLNSGWTRDGERVILGIDAADWQAEVWLNGVKVGEHENGYLPFELDVTGAVKSGENLLTIRVCDPPEIFEEIPHGKQSWYGMLSGLWQSVWIERRPARYIKGARILTQGEQVTARVDTSAQLAAGERLRVEVIAPDGTHTTELAEESGTLTLTVPNPLPWGVGKPNLYTARVSWLDGQGQVMDRIDCTFGFRTIETRDGQILLNGQPLYVRAALDQDYYPDLTCTPPSLDYIKEQFRQALAMGLNMLRVHIKVADPRYYQAADEVGLLIWTELPNWELLTERAKAAGRQMLEGMVARDGNHPSIVIWTVINESWGVDLTNPEHRAWLRDAYHYMKELDPTRPVVGNSACHGNFQVATDIADFHIYYAMPDHYTHFRDWVANYASRPGWVFAHPYQGYEAWRGFVYNQWDRTQQYPPAPENEIRGDEPLLLSEFGNWGLPDVDKLLAGYGGKEPWWFETGYEFGDGIVYPHGIRHRFTDFHLNRAFPNLSSLAEAHQRLQFEGMKYEIEQIRKHESVQGYVITEFTDVHWECNGLLDMHRNPKAYYEDMPWLNADDVIIPEWERLAYWAGEECWLRLHLSHYSPTELHNCTLKWSLTGVPEALSIQGSQGGLSFEAFKVNPCGNLRFEVPAVTRPTRARLELRLLDTNGVLSAYNELELLIFPYQRRLVKGTAVYLPAEAASLAAPLRELGCKIVTNPSAASLAITTTLTDALRDYALAGGRVLWLAESAASCQSHVPGLALVDRRGTPWQGDWASSIAWLFRDRLFNDLPGTGLVDFAFAGITPEAVAAGVPNRLYELDVHGGMAVGWLHRTAATIVERRWGRGKLLLSTFRLSENVPTNPLAAYMLAEMVEYLAR